MKADPSVHGAGYMQNAATTALAAVLFVLSVCLIFVPEIRSIFTRTVCIALAIGLGSINTRRAYKAGWLGMTPGQLYRAPNKPKGSVLEVAALLTAVVAMTMPY